MSKRRTTDHLRIRVGGNHCVYCGEHPNSTEHFPPYTFCNEGWLLPCCLECNSLAGTEFPNDFARRAEYVTGRLRWRYRKQLRMPEWSDPELSDLGDGIADLVRSSQIAADRARRRLEWPSVDYMRGLTSDYEVEEAA